MKTYHHLRKNYEIMYLKLCSIGGGICYCKHMSDYELLSRINVFLIMGDCIPFTPEELNRQLV